MSLEMEFCRISGDWITGALFIPPKSKHLAPDKMMLGGQVFPRETVPFEGTC